MTFTSTTTDEVQGGPIMWPLNFLDLTHLDFFLWGFDVTYGYLLSSVQTAPVFLLGFSWKAKTYAPCS